MTRSRATWWAAALLGAIAVAARLPQLLSPNLLAEGDECLVGLMAMHVARGHDFPLFFYGQKYGLAIVEAVTAAASFALFGAGPVTLKAAILAVWIAGTSCYFRAFARVLSTGPAFAMTLLLVLMPAWAATSMKAWSGYVTAFGATGLVIDLVIRYEDRRATTWLAAGCATALVYLAQPLWIPGLLPIVLYHLAVNRTPSCVTAYATGTVAPVAAIAVVKHYWMAAAPEVWFGPTIGNPHLLASAPALLRQIYVNLTGSFYFAQPVTPGRVTAAVAAFWLALLFALLAVQALRLLTGRHLTWSYLLTASIVLTLVSNWVLLEERDARYVMAMNVPLVFLAGVELFDIAGRFHVPLRRCAVAVALLAIAEAAAMREFSGYTFMWWKNVRGGPSESRTLSRVIGYLEARGVARAYSTNALLEWTITFYSREAVITRWKGARDRYPPYIATVDRALESGRPVAIVGYAGFTYGLERLVPDPGAIVDIDGKYFVYVNPDRELLARAGFQLVR